MENDEGAVVNLEKTPPTDRRVIVRNRINAVIDVVVPCVIAAIIGFYIYAFAYVVVWHHVRKRSKHVAIALIVIFAVFLAYIAVTWALIHIVGPGKVDAKYPLAGTDDDPFLSDQAGYALWCSTCKHVKPSKTHHSSQTDTCVPVMDHYCIYISAVIGQRNRKLFIQFTFAMVSIQILVFVVLLIYQHDKVPHIAGVSIAMYILLGLWLPFTIAVLFQHVRYLIFNQTTIDMLNVRRKKPVYVNLSIGDEIRRVVEISDRKDLEPGPFHQGYYKNLTSVMGPVWLWLVPLPSTLEEPKFNEKYVEALKERARKELEEEQAEHPAAPPSIAPSHTDASHADA